MRNGAVTVLNSTHLGYPGNPREQRHLRFKSLRVLAIASWLMWLGMKSPVMPAKK